jgi:hypothetical protein
MNPMIGIGKLDDGRWLVRWRDERTMRWRRATFPTRDEAMEHRSQLLEHHEQLRQEVRELREDLDAMLSLAVGPDQLDHARAVVTADPRSRIGQLYLQAYADEDRLFRAGLPQ